MPNPARESDERAALARGHTPGARGWRCSMAFFKRSSSQHAPPALPPLEVRMSAWQADDERLRKLVEDAREFRGLTSKEIDRVSVALKPGERVYAIIVGARLIERRPMGGSWQGRSRGVSVRVPGTKSMRYRVGATKGAYVRGADSPTEIYAGTAAITDNESLSPARSSPANGSGRSVAACSTESTLLGRRSGCRTDRRHPVSRTPPRPPAIFGSGSTWPMPWRPVRTMTSSPSWRVNLPRTRQGDRVPHCLLRRPSDRERV